MIHQELLRRAVASRHPMIQLFVETLAPQLLLAFSRIPALGGSGAALPGESDPTLPPEAVAYPPETRALFGRANADQSLSAHLFNGIFAGSYVAELLPPAKKLRDIEWQVWILGFIVHDYTKIHGVSIEPRHMPQIRSIIKHQGERLNFAAFLPTWSDYLDDIAFLAQNTQKVKDAAMNWSLYPNLQLDERRILTLRYLSSFADVLVHITRPADVAERDSRGRDTAQNMRSTLGMLFGTDRPPRLAYHQLTEVRGLLSNLINNSLMRALETQGYQPYLFFPDGVVYLVRDGTQAVLEYESLLDSLWSEVGATLSGINSYATYNESKEQEVEEDREEQEAEEDREGGLRITRAKDYLKVPPVLYELLSFEQVMTAARSVALNIAPTQAKTAARLGSELAEDRGIRVWGAPNEKQKQYIQIWQEFGSADLPTDVRADRIAEFCAFLHRRLKGIFPKADWLSPLLLDVIDIQDCMPVERVYRNNGGTPTGWFYAAAHYLRKHPHLDEQAIEELLLQVQTHALKFLRSNSPKAKVSSKEQAWAEAYQRFIAKGQDSTLSYGRFESAFRDYVQASITVDGQMLTSAAALTERFAREITQYSERKATNKVQCSLCSSPYEARQQDKSEVLFKPQQYSNKTRLDTSTVVRGICPICAIELMLRQVQQGMRAGSAQDEKPITLWLYPTYFFTAETSRVIHDFINRLHDLSLIDLLRQLGRTGFTLESLTAYESFVSSIDDDPLLQYSLNKPSFSDRDPASLFFFTLRAPVEKKYLTDTDSWIVPALYTLALPLLLDINVVATSSFVPIYSSGAEFRSTAVLDAPHSFTSYILDSDELRLDQLDQNLWRLLRLYELHLDVFTNLRSYTKWKDMHWGILNAVAKDVATDPLYVFSYYDRKQRAPKGDTPKSKTKAKNSGGDKPGDGIPPFTVNRYMAIYEILKARRNDPMSFIRKMVDAYAAFYRASNLKAAYAVLRPLATAMDVTMDSDPKTSTDDLFLLVAGALNDDQERVRRRQAEGFDPIKNDETLGTFPERLAISRQKIEAFTQLFLDDVFAGYCNGDRGILRERANRIRSAARFYYLSKYARRDQVTEDTDEPAAEL